MSPGTDTSLMAAEPDQRRRVRLFIAAHVGAVAVIYALAWLVGGGLGAAPMPPLNLPSLAGPVAAATSVAEPAGAQVAGPLGQVTRPEWTRQPEAPAPWESR